MPYEYCAHKQYSAHSLIFLSGAFSPETLFACFSTWSSSFFPSRYSAAYALISKLSVINITIFSLCDHSDPFIVRIQPVEHFSAHLFLIYNAI